MTYAQMQAFVGQCTTEETKDLLGLCIDALPEEGLSDALDTYLNEEQKAEFGESWFDIDRNK